LVRVDAAFIHACHFPQHLRNTERVDAGCPPPGLFITHPMNLAMVHPAKRDREFVALLCGLPVHIDIPKG